MPCLSSDGHEEYHGYPNIRLFLGYHGKTIEFEKYSPCHRTTVAHFLNKGKWDGTRPEDILNSTVIQFIYKEAQQSEKPVFCIVDNTISSKTKPSSRTLHPIEDAYFHQVHLKGKQNYGHQTVAVMLSFNGIDNAVVLISYPKDAFLVPKALWAFISTDVSLGTREILDRYVKRCPMEVFINENPEVLAIDVAGTFDCMHWMQ